MCQHCYSKSFASPSLLASFWIKSSICHCRYTDRKKALERVGITLSRQTMSNWIIKLYDLYFRHLLTICIRNFSNAAISMQMKQPWKYWNLKKVKEDSGTATYGFIKQEEANGSLSV